MSGDDDELREAARRQVKKRRDFGAHVASYVVVNGMLVFIWAVTGAGYFWPIWVIGLWGVGLALNAWDVYLRRPVTESDVDREVERIRGRSG